MNILTERIARHPVFRQMKPEHLGMLAHQAKEAMFDAGSVLFREGEPADRLYLIEDGRVALEATEPGEEATLIQVLKGGDILGWSWLFPPFAWHFQARCLEPVRVLILSGAHLLVAAERDHDFGYELMKRIARVLIGRLQAARARMARGREELVG